jgi:hypothetical protein
VEMQKAYARMCDMYSKFVCFQDVLDNSISSQEDDFDSKDSNVNSKDELAQSCEAPSTQASCEEDDAGSNATPGSASSASDAYDATDTSDPSTTSDIGGLGQRGQLGELDSQDERVFWVEEDFICDESSDNDFASSSVVLTAASPGTSKASGAPSTSTNVNGASSCSAKTACPGSASSNASYDSGNTSLSNSSNSNTSSTNNRSTNNRSTNNHDKVFPVLFFPAVVVACVAMMCFAWSSRK